ncbi:MAG: hypothetical protein O3A46_03760 [Candidatus Poribacteria bacterium]|nr:hypothetical protein [Candidatus Poribacteria bacterium]
MKGIMRHRAARGAFVIGAVGTLTLVWAMVAGGNDSGYVEYRGRVNSIVDWINNEQTPALMATGIDTWDNSGLTAAKTESTAVFRLVLNKNVTITAPTQTVLTQFGGTGETLATYYQLTSDGNGVTSTGFNTSGNGVGSFFYIGGGSTAWQTQQGLTAGTLLGSGKTLTRVAGDGNTLVTVKSRARNGEDLGSDSDLTEAPNLGNYTATLVLMATAIP